MRAEGLNHFRKRLLALKEELRARRDELLVEAERNLASEGGEEAERDFEGCEQELSLADNERALYQQVEDALGRIEAGTYGTCQSCGCEIPFDRLEAIPYASSCAACACSSAAR